MHTRAVPAFLTVILAFIALLCTAGVSGVSLAAESSNSFLIRHVDVFEGRTVKRGADVLVQDGLIAAVGTNLAIPSGLSGRADQAVIDGTGKTLLPGLIDAHVHSWDNSGRDALRFGVTTELDMFTDWHALAAARAQRQSLAQTASADLWSAGTLATVAGGHGTEIAGDDSLKSKATGVARDSRGNVYKVSFGD